MNEYKILKALKSEIDQTLMWFVEMDISDHGKITDSTKEAFKTQGKVIPEMLLNINRKNK